MYIHQESMYFRSICLRICYLNFYVHSLTTIHKWILFTLHTYWQKPSSISFMYTIFKMTEYFEYFFQCFIYFEGVIFKRSIMYVVRFPMLNLRNLRVFDQLYKFLLEIYCHGLSSMKWIFTNWACVLRLFKNYNIIDLIT